jgi:putative variant cofactor biosynthesis B12-binding/radical SAM domain protein 1
LDQLPFPRWQLFNPALYQAQNRYVAFIGVETKRGCAHRCRYCLYPALQGTRLRLRSPECVVSELETLQEQHDIQLVHYTDPVVNQPAAHLRAICNEIVRRRLEVKWTGFFREDSLTARDVDLYCRAGLAAFYFSADGASDYTLQLLGKDLTRRQILGAAKLAAASSILTVYHFLVNLPGEDRHSIDQTRELLDALFSTHASSRNLGAVVINNLRLYPGAPITEDILQNRLIDPRHDLLYPTYFNPPPLDHLRHELTAYCMQRNVADYLNNQTLTPGRDESGLKWLAVPKEVSTMAGLGDPCMPTNMTK